MQHEVCDDVSDTSDRKNWRVKITPKPKMIMNPSNDMKYCPGLTCCKYLPLNQFCANSNMTDGLDIYCLKCNKRKKAEIRKQRFQQSVKGGKKMTNYVMDQYERYKMELEGSIFKDQ